MEHAKEVGLDGRLENFLPWPQPEGVPRRKEASEIKIDRSAKH